MPRFPQAKAKSRKANASRLLREPRPRGPAASAANPKAILTEPKASEARDAALVSGGSQEVEKIDDAVTRDQHVARKDSEALATHAPESERRVVCFRVRRPLRAELAEQACLWEALPSEEAPDEIEKFREVCSFREERLPANDDAHTHT